MGLGRWFTRNWANTTEPTHADLTPLSVPGSPTEVRRRVICAAQGLRSWKIEDPSSDPLHITRRTRVLRFIDDVRVSFVPNGDQTLVHAESRSRLGKGDLGQNRRNILELFAAVRAAT